jgi:hypothetical protein
VQAVRDADHDPHGRATLSERNQHVHRELLGLSDAEPAEMKALGIIDDVPATAATGR